MMKKLLNKKPEKGTLNFMCIRSFAIRQALPLKGHKIIGLGEIFKLQPSISEAFYPQIILKQNDFFLIIDDTILKKCFQIIKE